MKNQMNGNSTTLPQILNEKKKLKQMIRDYRGYLCHSNIILI